MASALSARALAGIPELAPGDDLAAAILAAADGGFSGGEVLAVAHTAVSKVEGALVALDDVVPGERARQIAREQGKDPRVVEVVLSQSVELLRVERGVLISRTRHGFVCANAGVDASNTGASNTVVVLPVDPDASARRLRASLRERLGLGLGLGRDAAGPAVLITDTFGRAWRHGQVDVAIGLAGMSAFEDWRGQRDSAGMELRATLLAVADAVAAAADLVRRKDSGEPVVVIEGLERFLTVEDGPGAAALLRPAAEDLFL